MSLPTSPAQHFLALAKTALRNSRRNEARLYARQALQADPDLEDAWLILAGLATPHASLVYLSRVLTINPKNQTARKALHWAIQRERQAQKAAPAQAADLTRPSYVSQLPLAAPYPGQRIRQTIVRTSSVPALWILLLVVIACIGALAWYSFPGIPSASAEDHSAPHTAAELFKPSFTPTPTATFTPTPTWTPTFTPTITPSPTPTDTPTPTPTQTSTPLPTATATVTSQPLPSDQVPADSHVVIPKDVSPDQRWVDVNLSEQSAYAYQGSKLVNSFLVSTGTWLHPTVTGEYHVYVMYRYADMTGPGYYLPNVPYVMYFYEGYGLHGTYWHHNFGHPMSHGCINFRTVDAGWLFNNWVQIGTLVNIHY